jgi:SAM-dependent methyltransferase
MSEKYTLGYSPKALDFVSRRTLQSHGAFFIPFLRPGMSVLDCGCGPGTITLGIAEAVRGGPVVGMDMSESQVALARENAVQRGLANVSFIQGSVYELPLPDASFDAVFSHALFEHLGEPLKAFHELMRVLRPGGVMGVCTPDWGGFLYSPPSDAFTEAMRTQNLIQDRNGGDTRMGRKLLPYALEAGFTGVKSEARYQNYEDLSVIAEAIALQLEFGGEPEHAAVMRAWAHQPNAMFSQAWVSCVGWKG